MSRRSLAVRRTDKFGKVVILVDEDISLDKRVAASMKEYAGMDFQVIDCASHTTPLLPLNFLRGLSLVLLFPLVLLHGFTLWRYLRQTYQVRASAIFEGLQASLRGFINAKAIAHNYGIEMREVQVIHANDLACGLVGAVLSRLTGAKLIYDAHEIEFHRNRKNGWLRAAFDSFIEKSAIAQAAEIRVVNKPIANLYRDLYNISEEKIRIVHNNHFPNAPDAASLNATKSNQVAVVYVGGGTKGRQLEQLALEAARTRVAVHGFFIGDTPEAAVTGNWKLGSSDYRQALETLVASVRCVMWCCVDDACLSYRLSLPNKFFQAMAVGIPVIAASGTYLADLVKKYEIGYVFDGHNFDEIIQYMRGTNFELKLKAVYRLRQAITNGTVRI